MGQACSMGPLSVLELKANVLYCPIKIHDSPTRWCLAQQQMLKYKQKNSHVGKKFHRNLCKNYRQDYATLESDMERDNFMTADEAVAYGLADKIVDKRSD